MENVISISNGLSNPSPERINSIIAGGRFTHTEMIDLLSAHRPETYEPLHAAALAVAREQTGDAVRLRGIIEFSNRCVRNCRYCGIRKANRALGRYTLTQNEIIACAEWIEEQGYGSLVLQSGDLPGEPTVVFIEEVVKEIKCRTSLGVTLSVGEHDPDTYRRWFDAGAHRYLLRVETTNPTLYAHIHSGTQTLKTRLECLDILRNTGYQVGTGVMIGLPWQTMNDLANDLAFFRSGDFDMFGMGPYIYDRRTPMATPALIASWNAHRDRILRLSLNMLAVTRLMMRDVNIAATTALDAMHPDGRVMALNAGANVVMPVVTPAEYRESYQLYEGKPGIDQDALESRDSLVHIIEQAGRTIAWNQWGDSPHYAKRTLHAV